MTEIQEDMIILDEEQTANTSHTEVLQTGVKKWGLLSSINDKVASFQKLKVKDKVIFYRLLSTMLDAGMPLVKGIAVLEKQEKNPWFKKILEQMVVWLKEGKNLSECMDDFPRSFWQAEIGIIRSGEKTGQLNQVTQSLADQVEKVASISGKLKSALIYPAMIILVVIGVISIMMAVVVPKLLEIFEGNEAALPGSTKSLIFISDMFRNYWIFMIIAVVLMVWWITIWKKTPNGKYNFDNILLHLPVFGSIVQKVILSKFSRVFAWLMGSWVSVVESLKIVADAVGNEVYRQRILLLLEDVRQGMKIWEALESDQLFPDMMIQMIQVWEQSAKLDTTIVKVADFYDEQVDNIAATINKLLEPFIIVFLAVVVGFIALAIMQPIMNIADTVANN